jgi:hypothetical protein
MYCSANISRAKPPLALRVGIWELAGGEIGTVGQAATLTRLITAVRQQYPDGWYEFPAVICYDNSAISAGETFCVSSAYKHFRGAQVAAQYCNRSRAAVDRRWQEMVSADGGNGVVFAWPATP